MALGGDRPLNIRVDKWTPEDWYDSRDVTRSEAPGREGHVRWSWHTLSHLLVCPRRFQLAVLGQMVPGTAAQPLQIGIAVHTGMEVFWRRVMWEDRNWRLDPPWRTLPGELDKVVTAAATDAAKVTAADPRVGADERLIALRVLSNFAYEAARSLVAKWRPLWIEGGLAVDLKDVAHAGSGVSIPWEARPDLIVVEEGDLAHSGVWVVDHKTASRAVASELMAYRMDGQVLGNILAARLGGFPEVRGFIVNMLGKSAAPSFYHGYVTPGEALLREFADEVGRREGEFVGRMATDSWPRAFHRGACVDQYGSCAYYGPCEEGAGPIGVLSGTYPGFAKIGGSERDDQLEEAVDIVFGHLKGGAA